MEAAEASVAIIPTSGEDTLITHTHTHTCRSVLHCSFLLLSVYKSHSCLCVCGVVTLSNGANLSSISGFASLFIVLFLSRLSSVVFFSSIFSLHLPTKCSFFLSFLHVHLLLLLAGICCAVKPPAALLPSFPSSSSLRSATALC